MASDTNLTWGSDNKNVHVSTDLSNDTNTTASHWSSPVLTQITITIVVMIITLIGNITLILTLACNKNTRKRRLSVFLINLALGDLTVCVVTMTTEIIFVAFGEWVLGAVACKLTVYGQMVTLASSTFLLTAMSVDRYQVIVKPLRTLANRPKIWKKVTLAWILAFIFASPQLFIFVQVKVSKPDGKEIYKCRSVGYSEPEWQRKLYMTFMASYVLLVPSIIMTYCYVKIVQTLWHRGGSGSYKKNRVEMRMSGRTDLVRNSKRKAVKLSLTVISGFLICWIPYFVVSLIRIYSDYTIDLHTLLDFAEKMALVHSALNPIIYGCFSIKLDRIFVCLKLLKMRLTRCCRFLDIETETETIDISETDVNGARSGRLLKLVNHDINNSSLCHNSVNSSTSQHQRTLSGGKSDTNGDSKRNSLASVDAYRQRRETAPLLDSK